MKIYKTYKFRLYPNNEQETEEKQVIPRTIVGIDLGVKDLVITNYGEKLTNEKHIKKYEEKTIEDKNAYDEYVNGNIKIKAGDIIHVGPTGPTRHAMVSIGPYVKNG